MANVTPEEVARVRELVDIEKLVGETLALIGETLTARNHTSVGTCPFCDKPEGLWVSSDRRLFHCFGCKANGDVYSWVEKTRGMDFADAAAWLRERAGVE